MQKPAKLLLKILAAVLILMAILVVFAGVIGTHQEAAQEQAVQLKTNRDYLKEIIDGHSSGKIAADIIAKSRAQYQNNISAPLADDNWKLEENRLAKCIDDEQKKYLGSNDPYLDQVADENSADILAVKFLQSCKVTIAPH